MNELQQIRRMIAVFIVGLTLSGITAFPLVHEASLLVRIVGSVAPNSAMFAWVTRVNEALAVTSAHYPMLAYGTDWLAFAHLLFAVLFIGPWRDPIRNRWVLEFGVIACVGILPLALIAGPVRGIPFFWRLGDCSFGIFGAIPLLIALRKIRRMEGTHAAV